MGVRMIRAHMNDIPQFGFAEGFGIRPMTIGEGHIWTDIVRDAEEYQEIRDEQFMETFGADPEAIPKRCFFIINDAGEAVGTISAWYSTDFKGQDYGLIHWVAIRPAYQGKGLGKAALTYAMNCLAQWHERCWLNTDTQRIPAVTMYLNFGFEPDLDPPGAVEAWRSVRETIHHPTLERLLEGK